MEKLIDFFPFEQAELTDKGILFKGFIYSCSIAIREQWYGKEFGSISIYFDNYDDEYILVLLKDGGLTIAYRILNDISVDRHGLETYQAMFRSIKEQIKKRKKRNRKK
ncbi:Mu transposase C-terminal domain-containing protein [Paenibacillus sp. GbtcB18]|uniref:Mu transposase C-terminal domain-containing protein n=1 Tax=Paenibacillus sp. GbtcB18 TaxID=2824763 RepID=UPI001C2F7515|nr:Mu transposase C-terminal domain-containing protein [Paenibacillus sp. GbtcB18]